MYVATEERIQQLDKEYSLFRVPNTTSEAIMEEWAYMTIIRLVKRARSYNTMFTKTNVDEQPISGDPVFSFISRMYSYIDGTWDGGSLQYLNKQYGQNNVLPARLINYPLIRNKFDSLIGQFQSAKVELNLTAISEDAIEEKIKKRSELIFKQLTMPFVSSIEQQTGTQLEPDKQIPENIEKYIKLTYKEADEMNMQKLLMYNFKQHHWHHEMSKGLLDILCLGFTVLKNVKINSVDVAQRKINLKNAILDFGVEDDFGKDMMFIGEERYMSLDEVQTEYDPTDEELETIREIYPNMNSGLHWEAGGGKIKAIELNWKAKETRFFKVNDNINVQDKPFYKLLAKGANPERARKGSTTKSFNQYNWYKAVLFGDKIILKVEKIDAPREESSPNDCYGEYTMMLYNRQDKKPNGMMEMVEGLQELFNEILFLLELELATSPGSVMEYDIRTKPKNVPLTDVFYHMKANKVVQVDLSKKGLHGQQSAGIKQHDLSPRASDVYINILMFVENLIDKMTGVTPMSQGDVPKDTFVGVMQQSIERSSFITKPYFTFYREGLRQHMKKAGAMLKQSNKGKDRKMALIMGAEGAEFFHIKGDVPYREYDYFFNDGSEDQQKKQLLLQLGEAALSSGQATYKELRNIIRKDNINEIYADLDKIDEQNNIYESKINELTNQVQQAQNSAPLQIAQLKGEVDKLVEQMKGFVNKDVAKEYTDGALKNTMLKHSLENQNANVD